MRIVIVGPGRAGGSLAIAAAEAGHHIAEVQARRRDNRELADLLGAGFGLIGEPFPPSDLMVLAVPDDAIQNTAEALATAQALPPAAVHLSGLVTTAALLPLEKAGLNIGSFHPLQSFPNWPSGSKAISGAYAAITARPPLQAQLDELARSLEMTPFALDDQRKPLYHAAAAACASYAVTALHLGEQLFTRAGIDFRSARPLVESVVANVFEDGAQASLTGPIARGDVHTVARQLEAVDQAAPEIAQAFRDFGRVAAGLAGNTEAMKRVLS